jgi:pimeloyl-ACP methyl ester carboxylesterase
MNTTSSNATQKLWALLIGIDEYVNVSDLRGCVNDVEALQIFLLNQLNVPENQIRVLTNTEAKRANILQAFQEFLIDNADIKKGDQLLFHYSGHGSRMLDTSGLEADGYNETLVPHDARSPGVYDISDKTLAALLDRLAETKGDNITVILDSCHSGSGTRRLKEPGAALSRRIPVDDRPPPADLDADLLAGIASRGAGSSGWASDGITHVLLAGCRDYEESNEYWARDDQQSGIWHGALTYFTLKQLGQMQPGMTYSELHERVATQVNAEYPTQMPQCEGDRDRQVFGGARVQRDPFITITEVDGAKITLSSGLVHGLRKGTELAIYTPEVRTRADLPDEPLASVEVTSVAASTAKAQIQNGDTEIPLHARGVITKHVYVGLRQTLALSAEEGDVNQDAIKRLRQAIQKAAPGDKPSPYLEILEDDSQGFDLRVVAEDEKLSIYNANGELLVFPEDIKDDEHDAEIAILHTLESIARFRSLKNLDNEEPGSELAGRIEVRLSRYIPDPDGPRLEDLPAEATGAGSEVVLPYDPEVKENNEYVVHVTNKSAERVYPHIFTMSADYSVHRLYPNMGQGDALIPHHTLSSGFGPAKGRRLEIYLPDEPRWDSSRDFLKVIVTSEPCDLESLEQGGLNVPPPKRSPQRGDRAPLSSIEQLLETTIDRVGTRHSRPAKTSVGEDWTTITKTLTVVRDSRTTSLEAPAGRVPIGDDLVLVKPEGFEGQVTLTTWGQATRGVDGDPSLRPPPALQDLPELFQPLSRVGTRSVGPTGLVLAFEVDEDSRKSITPENPLFVELPAVPDEDVTDLLAVVFDGEDYLLVGYAGENANTLELVDLPEVAAPTRGMGRTIRLFIYKKMGRFVPEFDLRRRVEVNGNFEYGEVKPEQFQAGDKVAVMVHGFKSDTRWMLDDPSEFLLDEVVPYDHILTWDYDTYGTHAEQTGKDFAQALKQRCGFGPQDDITVHVYAHSMGCLISRCMIELHKGHEMVDRLVMAGPPNLGSPIINMTRGAAYLVMAGLNQVSKVPAVGLVTWPMKELYKQGEGWADLVVDSDIIKKLNALEKPDNVPYLVLAGKNLPQEQVDRLNRLAHKVLDTSLDAIFGEDNDTAIGLSSLRGVRAETYPRLTIKELPCNHSGYFDHPESREAVKEWVKT